MPLYPLATMAAALEFLPPEHLRALLPQPFAYIRLFNHPDISLEEKIKLTFHPTFTTHQSVLNSLSSASMDNSLKFAIALKYATSQGLQLTLEDIVAFTKDECCTKEFILILKHYYPNYFSKSPQNNRDPHGSSFSDLKDRVENLVQWNPEKLDYRWQDLILQ